MGLAAPRPGPSPCRRLDAGRRRVVVPHTSAERGAEIARLLTLGATQVDVGQGADVSWTVLADPDGNEFCVLSSRDQ